MSYLGRTGKLSQRAYNKLSFLATAGQTVKSGLSYVAGFVEVYVNGTLLTDVVDYSASNGNSVTFLVALSVNDEVTVVSLKTFSVANMLPLSGGTLNGNLDVAGSVTADGLVIAGATDLTGNLGVTGDVTVSGGVVFGDAGGAAGTTNTSNTLDSYEEGTWTPAYVGSGVAGSSPTGVGTYTKVGRMVTVTANFGNFTASSATGNLHISGLPFTPSSASGNLHTGAVAASNLGADVLVSSVLVNEGYIRLRAANTSIYKSVNNASSIYLFTTVTYETA
jgi:hypothetical protein